MNVASSKSARLGNFLVFQSVTMLMNMSPGHSEVQVTLWKGGPSQKAPPFRGAGLVQLRVRRCQPRPQRALQSDQSVQEDQPPLTDGETDRQMANESL